jgi:predicted CoA-binding protein
MNRIRRILEQARSIAVLGATTKSHKAGFYVPDYLLSQGYRVFPVNPRLVGEELFGRPVVATLGDLSEPVDLVNVFRRPEHLPMHLDQLLALKPAVVWMQLGIRHDGVAAVLEEAGIEVVQDACTLAEHRAEGLGPVR